MTNDQFNPMLDDEMSPTSTDISELTSREFSPFPGARVLKQSTSAPSVLQQPLTTNPHDLLPNVPYRRDSINMSNFTGILPMTSRMPQVQALSGLQNLRPLRRMPIDQSPMTSTNRPSSVIDAIEERKQQRLIKNREAAKECRRKKKEYLIDLEKRVAMLTKENETLKAQVREYQEKLAKYQGNDVNEDSCVSIDALEFINRFINE